MNKVLLSVMLLSVPDFAEASFCTASASFKNMKGTISGYADNVVAPGNDPIQCGTNLSGYLFALAPDLGPFFSVAGTGLLEVKYLSDSLSSPAVVMQSSITVGGISRFPSMAGISSGVIQVPFVFGGTGTPFNMDLQLSFAGFSNEQMGGGTSMNVEATLWFYFTSIEGGNFSMSTNAILSDKPLPEPSSVVCTGISMVLLSVLAIYKRKSLKTTI